MKKTIHLLLGLIGTILLYQCTEPDNPIYTVLDEFTNGAILRTKSDARNSFQFNRSEPDQAFFVKIEQQDEENGDLLDRVDVYVTLNGSNYVEAKATTFERSAFTQNENGLNEIEISLTLTQAINAIGASSTDYSGGDSITVRLELVLTDGRTFSSDDSTGSLQGSYFSSPYAYNAVIKCIPASPVAGTYEVAMQDSYGDGWNGGYISVNIDGVEVQQITIPSGSTGNDAFQVPAGTSSLDVKYVSGDWDSEVTFQITRNGDSIFSDGPSPSTDTMIFSICNP